jgi:hypothetical protein
VLEPLFYGLSDVKSVFVGRLLRLILSVEMFRFLCLVCVGKMVSNCLTEIFEFSHPLDTYSWRFRARTINCSVGAFEILSTQHHRKTTRINECKNNIELHEFVYFDFQEGIQKLENFFFSLQALHEFQNKVENQFYH